MALDYMLSSANIRRRLEVSHDPNKAVIRCRFFDAEYAFFRQNIRSQKVLVAGSGLGHDSFELARYNNHVVGVELIAQFMDYSRKRADELGLGNVVFQHGDMSCLSFKEGDFDSSVLNMGTIGNFEDKKAVLNELLRVSGNVYFDFYPPTSAGLSKRKEMYSEERWKNVRIEGKSIVSDDGLDSASLSKREISSIVKSLNAKVGYYNFHEFSVMARLYR